MTCPKCSGDTRVIDSRADSNRVLRRRKCKECNFRFYTEEVQSTQSQLDFWVLRNKINSKCERNGGG